MPGGDFTLALADGRRLEGWASDGSSTAAVLLQVGTPSAGVPYEPMVAEATDRGLRFVTYSRPGYAGSTRRAGSIGRRLRRGRRRARPRARARAAARRRLVGRWPARSRLRRAPPRARRVGRDPGRGGAVERRRARLARRHGGREPRGVRRRASKAPRRSRSSSAVPPRTYGTGPATRSPKRSAASSPTSTGSALDGSLADYLAVAVPAALSERDLGLARRRPRVHPRLGVLARRHRRPGDRLAGPPGRDGSLRARRVARAPRAGRAREAPRGRGPPVARPAVRRRRRRSRRGARRSRQSSMLRPRTSYASTAVPADRRAVELVGEQREDDGVACRLARGRRQPAAQRRLLREPERPRDAQACLVRGVDADLDAVDAADPERDLRQRRRRLARVAAPDPARRGSSSRSRAHPGRSSCGGRSRRPPRSRRARRSRRRSPRRGRTAPGTSGGARPSPRGASARPPPRASTGAGGRGSCRGRP